MAGELDRVLAKALSAAAALPAVEAGTSYGTPALKVRGKFLARVRDAATLVVMCPLEEKELLMAAAPEIYYETDHYKGWPAVLVRIAKIKKAELAVRLERAWRVQAPKKLVKAFDEEPAETEQKPRAKFKTRARTNQRATHGRRRRS
jgi:hypothetical protein